MHTYRGTHSPSRNQTQNWRAIWHQVSAQAACIKNYAYFNLKNTFPYLPTLSVAMLINSSLYFLITKFKFRFDNIWWNFKNCKFVFPLILLHEVSCPTAPDRFPLDGSGFKSKEWAGFSNKQEFRNILYIFQIWIIYLKNSSTKSKFK